MRALSRFFAALLALALFAAPAAAQYSSGGGGGAISVPLNLALGTITTNQLGLNLTATFNSASTTFDAPLFENVTNTASHAGSLIADLQVGGNTAFSVDAHANLFCGTSVTGCQFDGYQIGEFGNVAISFNGGNSITFENGGTGVAAAVLGGSASTQGLQVTDTHSFSWASSSGQGNQDTTLCRAANGVVEVAGSNCGATGQFDFATGALTGVAVASLPASPAAGMIAYVTDANAACSAGTTPTGGGSTKCFVGYNGAAWKEFGI